MRISRARRLRGGAAPEPTAREIGFREAARGPAAQARARAERADSRREFGGKLGDWRFDVRGAACARLPPPGAQSPWSPR